MAGYKAHVVFGGVTAVSLSIAIMMLTSIAVEIVPFVLLLTMIGAVLPDVDSDTGVPVRILFFVLSLIAALYTLVGGGFNLDSILMSATVGLIVYFVIGLLFRKFTVHRGMFHSIPAALMSGLLAVYFFIPYGWDKDELRLVAISVAAGYLCHLLLDEINSAVNISGVPFVPKRSLGTALKLFSQSRAINVSFYTVLFVIAAHSGSYLW